MVVYKTAFKKIKLQLSVKRNKQDKPSKTDSSLEQEILEAPTVFFHYRFCDAFPGQEPGFVWFDKKKDIHRRLKILLAYPTRFNRTSGYGVTGDPIWWFRGSGALPIEQFVLLNNIRALMNIDELIIERIAAYRGRGYYEDFVYVQCSADKPTGIYNHDQQYLLEATKKGNSYREEYAKYKRRLITRQEHDDGAAVIKGRPVRIYHSELRSRNLTKYNFIISSKYSPYNCIEFSRLSKNYFGSLLKNEISFDDFVNWINQFPRNRNDN